MSDFLDRLAARAIGSETAGGKTALVPRLPSLFEPLQRAPIMPLSDDGETSPGHRETVSAAPAAPTIAPMRSPHAPVTAATDASRAAPAAVEPVTALAPTHIATSTPRDVMQPLPMPAVPSPSSAVERSVALPTPCEDLTPLSVRPRQTRIAAEQPGPVSPSRPVAIGALLPAPAPVFGATRAADAPGRSNQAAAMRTVAAPVDLGGSSREPVVHVSIGRLEVRAAPAAATPPRRRDGPQPSSLDDYLRQRGGKASP
jgi:hypothetical protein